MAMKNEKLARARLLRMMTLATVGSATLVTAEAADEPASDQGVQEIVVTATRREETLNKVPISVAAFTRETLDTQSVRTIDDLSHMTPGLNFTRQSFGSGELSNIAIRGVYATSGAATTGVYLDDTAIQVRTNSQTGAGSAFPEIFDLERVEVLRGPQGTLFGAGAEGGVVRFITPTPSLISSSIYSRLEASSTHGGDPSYEGGIAFGTPLVENKLAIRVSAYERDDGGWVDRRPFNTATPNDVLYRNVNDVKTQSLRGSLLWAPTEEITIAPSVFYQRRKGDDSGVLWESLSQANQNQWVNGYQFPQTSNDRFVIPNLKVNLDFSAMELASITSYFDRHVNNVWDYTQLNAAFIFGETYPFVAGWADPGYVTLGQNVFSQELRLSSTDPAARLKWTVGAFYSRGIQHDDFKLATNTIGDLIPVEAIFGIPLVDGKYFLTTHNDTVDKQYAFFGQADYRIAGGLSATAGLRYSITSLDFARTLGGPLNYPGSGPDVQVNKGTQKSKPVTPKLALNYQVDDNNLFYASASKGFRIGGVNSAVFANCTIKNVPAGYGPDSTWSYEVGSKNRLFGGALVLEQSLYYVVWNNIQQDVDAGCGGNAFTDNLGRAISKGFDLQATSVLSKNLTVSGSAGYVDGRLQKTLFTPDGRIIVRKGDALIGSPWQLALNGDFHRAIPWDSQAYFGAYVRYNSKNNGRHVAYDDPNAVGYDPTLRFDPAVTEVTLRTGIRHNGIDASLFVTNLFDAHPELSRVHDTPQSSLYYFSTLRPRTIGLTVTLRR